MQGRRVIRTAEDRLRWNAFQDNADLPYTVTFSAGAGRTLSQNGLLHMWFGELAKQMEDQTMTTIKGQCHRKYGLPIRMQDEQFAYVWNKSGAGLTYEQQCAFLASGVLNVSSAMSVKELTGYMDEMGRDYRAQGFKLTDPELLKYMDTAA